MKMPSTKQLSLLLGAVIVLGALAWIGFLVNAERPGAGEHAADDEHAEHARLLAVPREAANGQVRLAVTIDPQEGAEVGDLIKFTARVTDAATGRAVPSVLFTVAHWHTEDQKTVFASKGVAPDGTLSWQFNTHDGVPYEIRVTAAPTAQSTVQFAPLSVKPVAFVEPLAPPLRVKLLNTFYLVAVVAAGAAAGVWLALRRGATAGRRALGARPRVAAAVGR